MLFKDTQSHINTHVKHRPLVTSRPTNLDLWSRSVFAVTSVSLIRARRSPLPPLRANRGSSGGCATLRRAPRLEMWAARRCALPFSAPPPPPPAPTATNSLQKGPPTAPLCSCGPGDALSPEEEEDAATAATARGRGVTCEQPDSSRQESCRTAGCGCAAKHVAHAQKEGCWGGWGGGELRLRPVSPFCPSHLTPSPLFCPGAG